MKHIDNLKKNLASFYYKHKKRVIKFFIFALLLSLFPYPNYYFNKVNQASAGFDESSLVLPAAPPIPVNATGSKPPEVSAQGVYIFDIPSNVSLYQKNIKEKLLPASTTKIASGLVALDYYKLDDVLVVKTVINNGRTMGLKSQEKITAESLLYGMLVHSANDAAYTLAENYPGGVQGFVIAMNDKTREYQLDDTHFTNPIGFDDPGNFTTASDLGKLARVALENKIFAKIVATKSITVSDIDYNNFHLLTNVNELLGKIPGVAGVKTGFTENAGEILVSEVRKDGRYLLFVVLKSSDRFKETQKLIEWVFGNFTWKEIEELILPTPGIPPEDKQ